MKKGTRELRNVSPSAPEWEWNGHVVKANSKSEARAAFKFRHGKIPAGAVIKKRL